MVKGGVIFRHHFCIDHSASVGYSYLKVALWEAYISLEENKEQKGLIFMCHKLQLIHCEYMAAAV